MRKRVHVYYSGHVQGVGFRFTTDRIARSLGIAGWVRNMRDGRVEVVAEGDEQGLKKFLREIEKGPMQYYIHDVHSTWEEPAGEFQTFDIKF